jgi:Zn-dependent peptidase ImmA (M78 family)
MGKASVSLYPLLDKIANNSVYNRKFLKKNALPDWLNPNDVDEDLLFEAKISIAKFLGLNFKALEKDNPFEDSGINQSFSLKTRNDTDIEKYKKNFHLINRIIQVVLRNIAVNDYKPLPKPMVLRNEILKNNDYVSLQNILELSWEYGIPVIPLIKRPLAFKKFDGLKTETNERPIIITATEKKQASSLCFIIAHELGHVFYNHDGIFEDFSKYNSKSQEEIEANNFALTLLAGNPNFDASKYISLEINEVKKYSKKYKIDPEFLVFNYAFNTDQWKNANAFIKAKRIGNETGMELVAETLKEHIDKYNLTEHGKKFIDLVT